MLLVMDTAGIFRSSDQLWQQTWQKLEAFLPSLMSDLFGDRQRFSAAVPAVEPRPSVAAPSGDAQPVEQVEVLEKRVETLKLDERASKLNESFDENLPPSPMDPPVRHPTFFIGKDELPRQQEGERERADPTEEVLSEAPPGTNALKLPPICKFVIQVKFTKSLLASAEVKCSLLMFVSLSS